MALGLLSDAVMPLRAIDHDTRRGVIGSFLVHAAIALCVLRMPAPAVAAPAPIDVEILEPPQLPIPNDLNLGISGDTAVAMPTHAATVHVTRAALVVAKESAVSMASSDGDSVKATEIGPGAADDGRVCEDDDCVLEALNRCLAGDGDGCVEVGEYYEARRKDPFSAIKWYVKGCGLASSAGCSGAERIKNVMPLGWTHRTMQSPI